MDNIFGKDDSGNETELDVEGKEEKDSPSSTLEVKTGEAMDIDVMPIKKLILDGVRCDEFSIAVRYRRSGK